MEASYLSEMTLPQFSLWEKMKYTGKLISFTIELTARCNNNCRHCYIRLPKEDKQAKQSELKLDEIDKIANEAVSLGAVWCLITGGEPLLREDFFEIYLALKKKGLLVSVFTNACLITREHIELFKKYPPRDIEVTVYGVTAQTYEAVTRTSTSFEAFNHGLTLLLQEGIKVRLKAMALRSNVLELVEIARFCRERTRDYFRFDPFLHLRFDRDLKRNQEIISERLSPPEIVAIEKNDPERFPALKNNCDKLILPQEAHSNCHHLFHCGAGLGSFDLSYDGWFRLCSGLWKEDCIYNLKKGTLSQAYQRFVPQVRQMCSTRKEFLERCKVCPIINLCMWCPGRAHLETGQLDMPVDYFCEVAHHRAEMCNNRGQSDFC